MSRWTLLPFALLALAAAPPRREAKRPTPPSTSKKSEPRTSTAAAAPRKLEAELARATALEQLKVGQHAEAMAAIDKAIAQEPEWGGLYQLRADVRLKLAGPDAQPSALAQPKVGVDYGAIGDALAGAAMDLERYLQLTPAAPDRQATITSIAELRVREGLARAAARKQQALIEEEKERLTGRVKVDGEHFCFPNQVWVNGKCLGVPTCPGMMAVSGESCVDAPCTSGKVRVQGGRCCWAGQLWSELRFENAMKARGAQVLRPIHLSHPPELEHLGCLGIARCPAGSRVRPELGLPETCVPQTPRNRNPALDARCAGWTNAQGQQAESAYSYEQRQLQLPDLTTRDTSGALLRTIIETDAKTDGCAGSITPGSLDFCCP